MDLQLTQQHVLITGGSKGIGLACVQGFLREGSRVSLVSRSQANLDLAMQQLIREYPGAEWKIGMFAADLQIAEQAGQALTQAEQLYCEVDGLCRIGH